MDTQAHAAHGVTLGLSVYKMIKSLRGRGYTHTRMDTQAHAAHGVTLTVNVCMRS
jgi:hypothetical protein